MMFATSLRSCVQRCRSTRLLQLVGVVCLAASFSWSGTTVAQSNNTLTVGKKDTGSFGFRSPFAPGRSDQNQKFEFNYTPNRGAGGLLLTFSGWDLEKEGELSVLVDDTFVTFAQPTQDGKRRTVRLPLLDRVFKPGSKHTVEVFNNIGAREPWSAQNMWLRPLVGAQQNLTLNKRFTKPLGYRYGSNAHPEMIRYGLNLQSQIDLKLEVAGYDQNKYGETQIRVNDKLIGYLQSGQRKRNAGLTTLFVDSSIVKTGFNKIEFKQRAVGNRWGIASIKVVAARGVIPQCAVTDSKPAVDTNNRVTNQVLVLPGEDLVSIAQENEAGTEFLITKGKYRLATPIVPQKGDKFICEPGTVLDGSIRLNSAAASRSGSNWRISGAPSVQPSDYTNGSRTQKFYGSMKNGREVNRVTLDLFVDGRLYFRVDELSKVSARATKFGPSTVYYGTFFQSRDVVYLPVDPRRKIVEMGKTTNAFQSLRTEDNDDVLIENCTVEKFASGDISAAIEASNASNWVVRNAKARYNHTGGLIVGKNTDVYCGNYDFNGQNGISGTFSPTTDSNGRPTVPLRIASRSSDTFITGVTANYNNWAQYNEQWHAGGMKFVATDSVRVQDSQMNRNFGVGFWADFEVDNIRVTRNLIKDNAGRGVQIEISKNAVIDSNSIQCNSQLAEWSLGRSWYWGSNLLAKNSTNVKIEKNRLTVDEGQGIAVVDNLYTGRFFGTRDFRRAKDNLVQNNVISFTRSARPATSDPAHFTHQMMGLESDGPGSTGGDGAKNCTPPQDFTEQGLVSRADINACNAAGGMDATSSAANNVIKNNTYNIVNNDYTYWRVDGAFYNSTQIPRGNAFDFRGVTRQNPSSVVTCD